MDILSLDLARMTGFARGKPGDKPIYGTVELRKRGEPNGLAPGALGRWLRDHVRERGKPDLLICEHWMSPKAQKSTSIIEDSLRLNGAVHAVAGVYGIEVVEPYPATVRAMVCGKANAGDRDSTKRLVIDSLILRGLVPKEFRDEDAADAIAGLVYAHAVFGRRDSSFALTAR